MKYFFRFPFRIDTSFFWTENARPSRLKPVWMCMACVKLLLDSTSRCLFAVIGKIFTDEANGVTRIDITPSGRPVIPRIIEFLSRFAVTNNLPNPY